MIPLIEPFASFGGTELCILLVFMKKIIKIN